MPGEVVDDLLRLAGGIVHSHVQDLRGVLDAVRGPGLQQPAEPQPDGDARGPAERHARGVADDLVPDRVVVHVDEVDRHRADVDGQLGQAPEPPPDPVLPVGGVDLLGLLQHGDVGAGDGRGPARLGREVGHGGGAEQPRERVAVDLPLALGPHLADVRQGQPVQAGHPLQQSLHVLEGQVAQHPDDLVGVGLGQRPASGPGPVRETFLERRAAGRVAGGDGVDVDGVGEVGRVLQVEQLLQRRDVRQVPVVLAGRDVAALAHDEPLVEHLPGHGDPAVGALEGPGRHVPEVGAHRLGLLLAQAEVAAQRGGAELAEAGEEVLEAVAHLDDQLRVGGVVPGQPQARHRGGLRDLPPSLEAVRHLERRRSLRDRGRLVHEVGDDRPVGEQRAERLPVETVPDEVLVHDPAVVQVGPVHDDLLGVQQCPEVFAPGPALLLVADRPRDPSFPERRGEQFAVQPLVVQRLRDGRDRFGEVTGDELLEGDVSLVVSGHVRLPCRRIVRRIGCRKRSPPFRFLGK
ncbi:hypothetical protein [Actinomadura sp. CNU-125]|uniref:hypothetical protein n=1 Tax=Actinomadura sp. CNU-125 TaxID=1904961 RepID=UPI00096AB9EC